MCSQPQVQEHIPLVYAMARRLRIPDGEWADVIQAGLLGLVQAANRFNPERGVRFSSYAVPLILGEMRAYLRRAKSGHAGRRIQEQSARLLAIQEELAMKLGRQPSLKETAERAGISPEDAVVSITVLLPVQSMEAEEEKNSVMNLADGHCVEEETVNALAAQQAMAQLNDQHRRLVKMRFLDGQTQKQVGEKLGISQAQVSRMEKQALSQLRQVLEVYV